MFLFIFLFSFGPQKPRAHTNKYYIVCVCNENEPTFKINNFTHAMPLRTRSIPQKNNCVLRWLFFSVSLASHTSLSYITILVGVVVVRLSLDCLVKEKQYYCCLVDLFSPSFKTKLCAVYGPFNSMKWKYSSIIWVVFCLFSFEYEF